MESCKIICLTTDVIYPSISAASKDLKISIGLIHRNLIGKCKEAKGYNFSYYFPEIFPEI